MHRFAKIHFMIVSWNVRALRFQFTRAWYFTSMNYKVVRRHRKSMDDDSSNSSAVRVSSFQRAIEARVANPLFRTMLQSRFHWIVSGWLILISYVGPRSGRRYTFPVAFHEDDGTVIVLTPTRESNWWRNFRQARECRIWLRGRKHLATGEVVTEDDRESLLAPFFEKNRLLGRLLGMDSDVTTDSEKRTRPTGQLAVVRFFLEHC